MQPFRDDAPVDAYVEALPRDDLADFFRHLRDTQQGFAAGAYGLADFSLHVDPEAFDLEASLFAAVVFGYKWYEAAPALLSDDSVTLSEYVDRVEPRTLGGFFEEVLAQEVAYAAGDLTAADLTPIEADLTLGCGRADGKQSHGERAHDGLGDDRVDVGQLLVKAVIFGVKLADERTNGIVLGETASGPTDEYDSDVGESGSD